MVPFNLPQARQILQHLKQPMQYSVITLQNYTAIHLDFHFPQVMEGGMIPERYPAKGSLVSQVRVVCRCGNPSCDHGATVYGFPFLGHPALVLGVLQVPNVEHNAGRVLLEDMVVAYLVPGGEVQEALVDSRFFQPFDFEQEETPPEVVAEWSTIVAEMEAAREALMAGREDQEGEDDGTETE